MTFKKTKSEQNVRRRWREIRDGFRWVGIDNGLLPISKIKEKKKKKKVKIKL